MRLTDCMAEIGQPFAFYPSICRKFKVTTNAAVLLCLISWRTLPDSDGWVEMSQESIQERTGLSPDEQRTARGKLVKAELLEERQDRLKHRAFYRVVTSISRNRESQSPETGNGNLGESGMAISTSVLGKERDKEKDKEKTARQALPAEAELWNKQSTLPKVARVSPARMKKLTTRRADAYWRQNVEAAIRKIAGSDFCLGGGPRGWVATFDWLLQPDTVLKAMEGKYDNRRGAKLETAGRDWEAEHAAKNEEVSNG